MLGKVNKQNYKIIAYYINTMSADFIPLCDFFYNDRKIS